MVDDEPDLVDTTKTLLEMGGYDTLTARTGEECLLKAEKERPDLILLDVLLPGMSGLEVSRRLKNNNATKDIPIIIVTALVGEDTAAKSKERGAKYFISKPFDPEELLAKIKSVVGK
ncbi:MAG: response regulator [Candidatus Omnitrophota bacterium]|nr:response regulator [Candidatus Omnitrophota bacterium]